MLPAKANQESHLENLYQKAAGHIDKARQSVQKSINAEMVEAYWLIGKDIVELEQDGQEKAGYGKAILKDLSKKLQAKYKNGFSVDTLEKSRKFYLSYPPEESASKSATLSRKLQEILGLSWSHYVELIKITRPEARDFYAIEASKNGWNIRELRRQIDSFLYDRLLKSKDKNSVLKMAYQGIVERLNMLKKSRILSALLSVLLISCSNMGFADSLDDQLNASISAYLAKNQTPDHISAVQLSVLLPHEKHSRDYIVGTQYFGTPPKATTDMMFQWGSITKEYTNVLIFQLVHQDLFKTTDTLGILLPSYFDKSNKTPWPAAWKKITVNQLMNMTSGIPSYDQIPNGVNPNIPYTLEDLVSLAADYQNKNACKISDGCFPAGSNYFYSNTNYIILGLMIQQFSGTTYADALNTKILAKFQNQNPVNLYYDADYYSANALANMVHSYYQPDPTKPIWIDITNWNFSWAASAGALTGNMKTLIQMTHALYHDHLTRHFYISDLEQNLVQTNSGKPIQVQNIKTGCSYNHLTGKGNLCYANGIQVFYDPSLGEVWTYAGITLGYRTIYLYFKDQHGLIIALSQNARPVRAAEDSLPLLAFQISDEVLKYLNQNQH